MGFFLHTDKQKYLILHGKPVQFCHYLTIFFFCYLNIFGLCYTRVLVGAASDPSINIDDPISDEFFFLVWNDTAKTNVNIYDKV